VGRLAAPVAVIAVVSVWLDRRHREGADAPLLRWAVAAYVAVAVASLAWTRDLEASLVGVGSLAVAIAYCVAVGALIRTEREISTLMGSIVASSVAVGVLWIVSFATGVSRFASDVGDPNFVAMQQAMAIPVAIALASHARRPLTRGAAWAAVPLIIVSIAASLSRGGVLALLAVLTLALFQRRRPVVAPGSRTPLMAATLLVGSAIAILVAGNSFVGRLATTEGATSIDVSREGLVRAALHAYVQAPVTGIGYGAFAPASYSYLRDTPGVELDAYTLEALIAGREVHNAYVQALTELGPIGAAAFVWVVLAGMLTCRRIWRSAREDHVRSIAAALAIGLVAFLVASMALSTQTTRTLWIWLGTAYALTRFAPGASRSDGGELSSLTSRGTPREDDRGADRDPDDGRDHERPDRLR